MAFFTSANAAEMGRRSGQARRANPVLRVPMARVRFAQPFANGNPNDTAQAFTQRHLAIVREQIVLARRSLQDEAMEPRDRAQLIRSLDTLLDRERVLMGVPLPGSRKPAAPKAAPVSYTVEPLRACADAADMPAPVPAKGAEPGWLARAMEEFEDDSRRDPERD